MVGTAQARLCPPYGIPETVRLTARGSNQQRRRRLRTGLLDALAHHLRLLGDVVEQPSLERSGDSAGAQR